MTQQLLLPGAADWPKQARWAVRPPATLDIRQRAEGLQRAVECWLLKPDAGSPSGRGALAASADVR
jgi:hypothetical protein